jgi:hypothetical protein
MEALAKRLNRRLPRMFTQPIGSSRQPMGFLEKRNLVDQKGQAIGDLLPADSGGPCLHYLGVENTHRKTPGEKVRF